MGYRLSRIYTKTGDGGTTGLGDGTRVPKDDPRVESYGEIDELNSWIGLLLTEELEDTLRDALLEIQHDLFDLGGELSVPGLSLVGDQRVLDLEKLLDQLNAALPPLVDFILPGGTRAAALSHVARTVCRRAERRLVSLKQLQPVSDTALRYLNRLSDLLFVIARRLNREGGGTDVLWNRQRFRRQAD